MVWRYFGTTELDFSDGEAVKDRRVFPMFALLLAEHYQYVEHGMDYDAERNRITAWVGRQDAVFVLGPDEWTMDDDELTAYLLEQLRAVFKPRPV